MSHERFEQKRRVKRTPSSFRVELHRKERLRDVNNSFVRTVVRVDEERLPPFRQRLVVDGIPMVLTGDVAPRRPEIDAGLVHAAVPVLHLVGLRAGGQREELVPEADPEDGDVLRDGPLQALDRLLALGGVAGAVRAEEAVPL